MRIIIQYFRRDEDVDPSQTVFAVSTSGLEREKDRLIAIIKQDKEEDAKEASRIAQEVIARLNV